MSNKLHSAIIMKKIIAPLLKRFTFTIFSSVGFGKYLIQRIGKNYFFLNPWVYPILINYV